MSYITWLYGQLKKLSRLSKIAVLLGFTMAVGFLVAGAVLRVAAPLSGDYLTALALSGSCLEAAPASFAVGVCAGLLGDLMIRKDRD